MQATGIRKMSDARIASAPQGAITLNERMWPTRATNFGVKRQPET